MMNQFMVASRKDKIILLNPPMREMSYLEALELAAWIVCLAEPMSGLDFKVILSKVQSGE